MKNVEIEIKLRKIHEQKYSLEEFNADLQVIKGIYVKENKQEEAKQIWIYQTIIKVHKLFIEAFNLLKSKQYYQGWCQLERIEITIRDLKKHFLYDKEQYKLWQIEKTVKNLQVIFPYRLFGSSEILKKKKSAVYVAKKFQLEILVAILLVKYMMEKCVIELLLKQKF